MPSPDSNLSQPTAGARGASGAPRGGTHAWDYLAAELSEIAALARSAAETSEFYPELLRRAVAAVAAEGGAVWLATGGAWRQTCIIDPDSRPTSADDQQQRQRLLAEAVTACRAVVFPARSRDENGSAENPSDYVVVIAPVAGIPSAADAPPAALIELSLATGLSPAAYDGVKDYLSAVADIAAEFHAFHQLARLNQDHHAQQRLLQLGQRVHCTLDLAETAAAIANEARDVIGCGRVSVLAPRGRGCRLLATSGVDRPDRRSPSVRGLENVSAICCRLGDPLYLAEGHQESLPQAADALDQYADAAHVRQVAVVPMRAPAAEDQSDSPIVGVLVAESFEGFTDEVARDRVTEASRVCASALRNALEVDATPLLGLLRSAKGLKRPGTQAKIIGGVVLLSALALGLLLIPAELRVAARGQLQPVVKQHVFAPSDAVVQRVLVEHGDLVEEGQPLAELHDAPLDLELKRVDGRRQTVREQLAAVRAARTSLDRRTADPSQAYRLSAEEQQLKSELDSLDQEKQLLSEQRSELNVVSPLAGRVLTWDLDHTIAGRPVQRGEVLMTVADTTEHWRLELKMPDDRVGYLLEAQESGEPISVEYRLGSQEEGFSLGRVERIAQRAEETDDNATPGALRSVIVYVTIDESNLPTDVRPGASVRARLLCGRRSLGYVWLHDLINTARVWWEF